MATYKSVRTINCSNPAIFSFDVSSDQIDLSISLLNPQNNKKSIELNINTNKKSGSLTEIVENVFPSSQNFNNHEDNTFAGEKVIIEYDESSSSPKPDILSKSEDGTIWVDSSLDDLQNGSLIFFLTENPKTDNVIHSQLGTFEQKDPQAYTITPYVLTCNESNSTTDTIGLLGIDDDSLTFILLGNEVTKNYANSPTTIYSKSIGSSSGKITTKEYQSSKDLIKSPYRGRIVISNDGRMVSFSIYNTSTKKWDTIKNFIFNIPKLTGERHIIVETNATLSNITANF